MLQALFLKKKKKKTQKNTKKNPANISHLSSTEPTFSMQRVNKPFYEKTNKQQTNIC